MHQKNNKNAIKHINNIQINNNMLFSFTHTVRYNYTLPNLYLYDDIKKANNIKL
jgi:hypothetical protein